MGPTKAVSKRALVRAVANVVKYLRDEASDYDNTSDLEARRTHIWHDVKVLHRWLTVRRVTRTDNDT